MDVERVILLQKKKDAARAARQEETADHRQARLEKQRSRSRSKIANETEEERVARLQKQRAQSKSKIIDEIEEERLSRQRKDREQASSNRATETKKQRERRLLFNKEITQLARRKETDEQRQRRRSVNRTNTEAARQNETVDQHNKRLQQQKSRSQANRTKNKINKRSSSGPYAYLRSISAQTGGSNRLITSETGTEINANKSIDSTLPFWPEPIPRSLKNNLLQQFVAQMSMSALAETTCAVCHVRAPVKKTKKLPVKEIPGLHLLVVSQYPKDLVGTSHSSNSNDFPASSRRDVKSVETGPALPGNHLYP